MIKIFRRICLVGYLAFLVISGSAHAVGTQVPPATVGQAVTQLADGRWLLSGGMDSLGQASNQLLIFDPVSGQSNPALYLLNHARVGHSATLMPDGRVLILGGVDRSGTPVVDAEVLELSTNSATLVGSLGLIPRAYHTAVLLPDRRILIAGGVNSKRQILQEAELLNTDDLQIERFNAVSEIARWQHLAQLLPNQSVLLSGGLSSEGKTIAENEIYDALSQRFGPDKASTNQLLNSTQGGQIPSLIGSLPADQTRNLALDTRMVVRFSQWMAPETLNAQNVRLIGLGKIVPATIVAAERGLLLFITPRQTLKSNTDYQLIIDGAIDALGVALPKTILNFHTADQQLPLVNELPATQSIQASKPASDGAAGSSAVTSALGPSALSDQSPTADMLKITGALKQYELPIIFEKNRGQQDSQIKFTTFGRGYRVHLSQRETLLDLTSIEPTAKFSNTFAKQNTAEKRVSIATWLKNSKHRSQNTDSHKTKLSGDEFQIKTRRVRMQLVGANPSPNIIGMDPLPSKTHYLDGRHPEHNIKDVPHYAKVLHTEVYSGIDKLYYGKGGKLEYDWIVKPGADPKQIAQRFIGIDAIRIDANGDAILTVNGNSFKQKKPIAFQTTDGNARPVSVEYVATGNMLRFKIAAYNTSLPLIIDPVVVFATYFGDAETTTLISDMQIANDESVYLLANTQGYSFTYTSSVSTPCTPTTCGNISSYLAKFKPDGTELDFLTQFVGSRYSQLHIVESASGPQAMVLGTDDNATGGSDTVLSKLNVVGDGYEFHRNPPGGGSFAVDKAGYIYILGGIPDPSLSPVYYAGDPAASGWGGGVAKLTPDASSVVYQFFFKHDYWHPVFVTVDNAGSPYLFGYSTGVLMSSSVVNAKITGSVIPDSAGYYANNTFLIKVNPSGHDIAYANYLFFKNGGSNVAYQALGHSDFGPESFGFDTENNLYVRGYFDPDPTRPYILSLNKYGPDGAFVYSTIINALDVAECNYCAGFYSMAIATSGEVYTSSSFIEKPSATTKSVHVSTGVIKFSSTGLMQGSPFILRSLADKLYAQEYVEGQFLRLSSKGNVFLSGSTQTTDFPVVSPIQGALTGGEGSYGAFLAKLSYDTLLITSPNPSQVGQNVTLTLANLGSGGGTADFFDGTTYLGSGAVNSAGVASIGVTSLSAGTHLLTGRYAAGNYTTTQNVKLNNFATVTSLVANSSVAGSVDFQIQVTGVGSPYVPSGAVTLMDGPLVLGNVELDSSGKASYALSCQIAGKHGYVARFTGDSNHGASDSAINFLSVGEAPINVAISSPLNGSTITVPTSVPFTVTATTTCADTKVASVSFFVNGAKLGDDADSPYNITWPVVSPGPYTLTATAFSRAGNTYTSPAITILTTGVDGGIVTYFHHDLSGNTIAATDALGNMVYTEQYRPYGEKLTNDPASQSAQASGNRIWFHGKVQDEATGLQYFGARYYDPVIGRFMGVDPAGFDPGNLHSANRYAYGNNNPYRYRDIDGNAGIDWKNMFNIFSNPFAATYGQANQDGGAAQRAFEGVKQDTIDAGVAVGIGTATTVACIECAIAKGVAIAVDTRAASAGAGALAKEIGILREAANGKGNFGLGSATRAEADKFGKSWVGDGYEIASDGKTLVSADKLRQYRPPSEKPRLGKSQANFEKKFPDQISKQWQSNGHLDVSD